MSEHETLNGALIECVKAAGGSKQVGNKLWPEKTIEAAQRHLLNCLNEDKPERLNPDQTLFVLRLARERGCHAGIEFVCASLGYTQPTPVEPADQNAELQRQYIEATRLMAGIVGRMEQLSGVSAKGANA